MIGTSPLLKVRDVVRTMDLLDLFRRANVAEMARPPEDTPPPPDGGFVVPGELSAAILRLRNPNRITRW